MTMQMYYILQLIGIFCAYFLVTLILPAICLHRKFNNSNLVRRVWLYFLVGNFYIMNLVFLLELLHISCKITLILGTLVPFILFSNRFNGWHIRSRAKEIHKNLQKLLGKRIGRKTLRLRRKEKIDDFCQKIRKAWNKSSMFMKIDFLIFFLSFLCLIYFYGIDIVEIYGYSASDLPVHNYWINALSDNQLFVAGIYPEGAHCIEYYLHAVFGFDTYVILSLFGFVQLCCVIYGALFLMKLCCKNRFLPYFGFAIYVCTNIWSSCTFARLYSALPQEYGMIFIMPAIYFGFEFFQLQYNDLKNTKKTENTKEIENTKERDNVEEIDNTKELANTKKIINVKKIANIKKFKKSYFVSLCGFGMSFAMTFMVHFYNTIILGLCCVAMAVGYFGLFIKKEYIKKIIACCFISLFIAILPMVIMFVSGTPLQGSLKWGLGVIFGESDDEDTEDTEDTVDTEENIETDTDIYADTEIINSLSDNTYEAYESVSESNAAYSLSQLEISSMSENYSVNDSVYVYQLEKKSLLETIKEKNEKISKGVNEYTFCNKHKEYYVYILIVIGVLFAAGLLYHIIGYRCYGCMLFTIALCQIVLIISLTAGSIGIPRLMDPSRASIYNAYFIPVTLMIGIDSILTLLDLLKSKLISNTMDFAAIILLVYFIFLICDNGYFRIRTEHGFLETNEAVTCLTNIIRTQKDFSWTILSANDETQMGIDHGYHYETITLLHEIENLKNNDPVYIPTEKIFVFIEKMPLNYQGGYYGEEISEEYADRKLPDKYLDLGVYEKENRMICMSRLYYWMQAFKKIYPEDVQVYFENDNFVCYVINQNTYSQFDLAIDYGYNLKKY